MTAANHALTGAFIGLAVGNPWVALPAAFASHFVCDAIPHYDVPGKTNEQRIASKTFLYVQILAGAAVCAAIVLSLALIRHGHWLTAIFGAFLAASPDLGSFPRFLSVRRGGKDNWRKNWFWRFHHNIQWFQKPVGWVVEAAWFAAALLLIQPFLT